MVQNDLPIFTHRLYQIMTLAPLHKDLLALLPTLFLTTSLVILGGLFTSWCTRAAATPLETGFTTSIVASDGPAISIAKNCSGRLWRCGKSRERILAGRTRSRTGAVEGC